MRSISRGSVRVAAVLVLAAVLGFAPTPAQQATGPSQEELAKANNPLADLTSVNVQNYYVSKLTGLSDETANTLWLRVVKPVGRWLIRASLPLPTVPSSTAVDPESGLGDLNAFGAYLLKSTSQESFGVGPLVVAPTASNDALGTGKWQGGAAAVFFKVPSPQLQWGGLVTWQASFAGDDDRSDTNVAAVQPFAIFQLGKGTYLRSTAIWVFDLENDVYNMPIGLGIGKVSKVGRTVFNLFVEPQFTFLHQGAGQPELQILAGLNMQFTGGGK